ncbi:MAG: type III secretion system export apparatus subunit SctV [Myxococcaceae bacterium]|nr:type III secretion system export apparatus subunit SctV [Myxococcaceae bacterium]MBH2006607.1 type III secretion system export apparatus subunit SctV [Myxococcaceae bacterium]
MGNLIDLLLQGNLGELFKRYSDICLAFLVVTVMTLLIVPVPTFLIDLLICTNISIALTMLLVALYVSDALHLSSFPTILLVTTLFRLGINVATARRILLDADAGTVITAFGEFTVQGNFIVGVVMFLLLMLINMLVIAKGSERVAEVAARFTLDAMPGKQMSIDADLRNGSIDLDTARKKRMDLGRESQLFGAMDGAMKFVKGDVIAGIIIFILNIVAGMSVGVLQKGMTVNEAIETYSILSIGDGLVSIIPALLMSVCAGLIVTRVNSGAEDSNLGQDIANQVLAQPKAFAIASAFITLVGQVPGLPRIPFTIIGLTVGGIAYALFRAQQPSYAGAVGASMADMEQIVSKREQKLEKEKKTALQKAKAQEGNTAKMMPVVTPISLEVASDLVPLVDDSSNFLAELIPTMRDGLFYELGIRFPGIRVRGSDASSGPGTYVVAINEIPVAVNTVDSRMCLVNDTPDRLKLLGIQATIAVNPANGVPCSWMPNAKQALAEQAGLTTWDAASYMVLHLSASLRKQAADFVGIQEVQNMLDQLEQAFPALVKEVIPKAVNLFQLTEILKRLVEEEISIRDLKTILQALAEWGPHESDPVLLTEQVRISMKRYMSHKFTGGQHTLVVYLLEPQLEETVSAGIQHGSAGGYLALEPEVTNDILTAIRKEISNLPATAQQPVILTPQEIRRYFRKLVEIEFPHLAVLSYQELSSDINIQPIARIGLG